MLGVRRFPYVAIASTAEPECRIMLTGDFGYVDPQARDHSPIRRLSKDAA